jgi:hypothetical protein
MCKPHIVAKHRVEIHVSTATNIKNKEELVDTSFSVWSVSYQREAMDLCIAISLLGNDPVTTL